MTVHLNESQRLSVITYEMQTCLQLTRLLVINPLLIRREMMIPAPAMSILEFEFYRRGFTLRLRFDAMSTGSFSVACRVSHVS